MVIEACPFCQFGADEIVAKNDLAFAVRDKFPIMHLQTLVIPRRHVVDYFDLREDELSAIHALLRECRIGIFDADASVGGFNVGANVGRIAGQKISHVHIHLIPRPEMFLLRLGGREPESPIAYFCAP